MTEKLRERFEHFCRQNVPGINCFDLDDSNGEYVSGVLETGFGWYRIFSQSLPLDAILAGAESIEREAVKLEEDCYFKEAKSLRLYVDALRELAGDQ